MAPVLLPDATINDPLPSLPPSSTALAPLHLPCCMDMAVVGQCYAQGLAGSRWHVVPRTLLQAWTFLSPALDDLLLPPEVLRTWEAAWKPDPPSSRPRTGDSWHRHVQGSFSRPCWISSTTICPAWFSYQLPKDATFTPSPGSAGS